MSGVVRRRVIDVIGHYVDMEGLDSSVLVVQPEDRRVGREGGAEHGNKVRMSAGVGARKR